MNYGNTTPYFGLPANFNILGYHLECTCGACPEQYDVIKGGQKVGYLRLRHGSFTASYPYMGDHVYHANPVGDGVFEDAAERQQHLTAAIEAIAAARRAGA